MSRISYKLIILQLVLLVCKTESSDIASEGSKNYAESIENAAINSNLSVSNFLSSADSNLTNLVADTAARAELNNGPAINDISKNALQILNPEDFLVDVFGIGSHNDGLTFFQKLSQFFRSFFDSSGSLFSQKQLNKAHPVYQGGVNYPSQPGPTPNMPIYAADNPHNLPVVVYGPPRFPSMVGQAGNDVVIDMTKLSDWDKKIISRILLKNGIPVDSVVRIGKQKSTTDVQADIQSGPSFQYKTKHGKIASIPLDVAGRIDNDQNKLIRVEEIKVKKNQQYPGTSETHKFIYYPTIKRKQIVEKPYVREYYKGGLTPENIAFGRPPYYPPSDDVQTEVGPSVKFGKNSGYAPNSHFYDDLIFDPNGRHYLEPKYHRSGGSYKANKTQQHYSDRSNVHYYTGY